MGASYGGLRVTYAVEGRGVEVGVDVVGTSDGVGSEEGDNLEGRESSGVIETLKDVGDAVLGLGDQTVDSRSGRVGATSKELETGCTLSFARVVLALGEVTGERIILTGQLVIATAPANWTRSPAEILGNWERKGMRLLTESAIPRFAKNAGSTVGKMSIDPSAPPPLYTDYNQRQGRKRQVDKTDAARPLLREMAIASSVVYNQYPVEALSKKFTYGK